VRFVLPVIVALCMSVPGASRLAAQAWLYTTPAGQGFFQHEGGGRWFELTPDGHRLSFMEAGRSPQYVELYDAGRRMRLRLHPTHSEWRQEPQPQWVRLYSGRWISPSQLPALSDYEIRLAYFVPKDRQPIASYEPKIRVLMHFVTLLYRQSLGGRGHPAKDLVFQTRSGEPVIHLIRGARPAAFYNGAPNYPTNFEQFGKLAAEIPPHVGVPEKHIIILFAETYDAVPARVEWAGSTAGGARYSNAGGLGIFSAWILQNEFTATSVTEQRKLFFDETPIPGRTAMGHGRPNSPRFEFIEDGFGAVAHELAHAFGLLHDCRRGTVDIMCHGFRNIRWNFADPPQPEKGGSFTEDNVRLMLSSRFLSTELDRSDNVGPRVTLRIVTAALDRQPAKVTVAVDTTDDRALRALTFFAPHQDSVVGGRWLSGKSQSFTQELTIEQPKSGEVQIHAQVADTGGNLTVATATVRR
jgi:hypothetical protein